MAIKIFGIVYPDPSIHDRQHLYASLVALITGTAIFVTYYFMTRMEASNPGNPWDMPWYYFVVGVILSAFTLSAISCMLSTAIRPRSVKMVTRIPE